VLCFFSFSVIVYFAPHNDNVLNIESKKSLFCDQTEFYDVIQKKSNCVRSDYRIESKSEYFNELNSTIAGDTFNKDDDDVNESEDEYLVDNNRANIRDLYLQVEDIESEDESEMNNSAQIGIADEDFDDLIIIDHLSDSSSSSEYSFDAIDNNNLEDGFSFNTYNVLSNSISIHHILNQQHNKNRKG
jgi:hypothetical protein